MQKTEFFTRMKDVLVEYERNASPLFGWELIQSRKKSHQRLYEGIDHVRINAHQDREVDEISYSLTVYSTLEVPDSIGMASSTIYPFNDIHQSIDEVVTLSLQSKNRKWELPGKQTDSYPVVSTCDQRIKIEALTVMEELEDRVESELSSYSDITVNSAEAYVNYENILRETHTGISTSKEKSDVYFEIAMEKRGRDNDKEVHEILKSVRFEDMDFSRFIGECVLQVQSLGNTVEPDTEESPVILADTYFTAHILAALTSQLQAANEYHHLPFLNTKDKVFIQDKAVESDTLTVELDPFVDGFTQSGGYTAEGLITEKAVVIEDDEVKGRQVSNRYGQYLGLKPNGIAGNMRVTAGKKSVKALREQAGAYYEIIKLSSLLVNERNLTWSSEIKLAEYHDGKGNVSLIKGGVISGSIRENLSDFNFSTETDILNSPAGSYDPALGYLGPKYMLIRKGVSIAGN